MTVADPSNDYCDHAGDSGWLLVSSLVYWSPTRSTGLLPTPVLRPSGIGRYSQYRTRPIQFRGTRCSSCQSYRAALSPSCVHELERGFVFPHAPLHWWPHEDLFNPTFLYPIVLRDKDGGEPEAVFAPKKLMVSISDARCPARKCVLCSGVEVLPNLSAGG
jgi:hypothetical protein